MVNHPVVCRGLSLDTGPPSRSPLLVDRAAVNLVSDLMADLSDQNRRQNVLDEVIRCADDAPARLTHPAQRTVTLALLETLCETVMEPRLDPTKIDSAGLVVRRVARNAKGHHQWSEAWMTSSDGTRGWFALTKEEALLDPDPARRRGLGSGSAYLDAQYAQLGPPPRSESTSPVFVAPPQLCGTLKKTLMYGIVPTSDQDVASPGSAPAPPTDSDLDATIPLLLKTGSHHVPLANQTINPQYSSFEFLEQNSLLEFKQFLALLQATVVQYGIFDGTNEGNALLALLNNITVMYPPPDFLAWLGSPNFDSGLFGSIGDIDLQFLALLGWTIQPLGDLLLQADAVLLNPDAVSPKISQFTMPSLMSDISDDLAGQIFDAIKATLAKKSAGLVPNEGRFDDRTRYYRVKAFVRVKDTPQCPPQIVWTHESGPFQIAPWYEGGKLPPIHVELPDPTDRNGLKSLKPNVSFRVPGALQQMLQSISMRDLTSASAPSGNGVTVDWICGFSIPIITICAFIALSIFLILLNIVFWWLPFVKICIPVPKK